MPPVVIDGLTGITTPGLTNTGTETIVNLTTTGNTILGDASTDTLNVGNGGLVKDASGNVGIGTASPSYKLDVSGNVSWLPGVTGAPRGYLSGASADQSIEIGSLTNSPFGIDTNAVRRMTIDTSGNVGIGTTTPSSSSIVRFLQVDNATSSGLVLNAARKFSIYSSSSSTLSFLDDTAGAERMRIDSTGVLTTYGVTTASGASVAALQGNSTNTTVNSSTYNVTFGNSAKVFWVSLASGDGCLVITNYLTSTITIVGTGGNIVASASPTASQLGISKSVNSHVVTFKTGSAAATQFGSWSVGSLSSTVS